MDNLGNSVPIDSNQEEPKLNMCEIEYHVNLVIQKLNNQKMKTYVTARVTMTLDTSVNEISSRLTQKKIIFSNQLVVLVWKNVLRCKYFNFITD